MKQNSSPTKPASIICYSTIEPPLKNLLKPLGERLDPLPRETNRAEHGPLAQQRHPKDGTLPGCHSLGQRVVRISANVRDMHDPAFERHPSVDAVATGDNGSLAQDRPMLGLRCSHRTRHIAMDLALAY